MIVAIFTLQFCTTKEETTVNKVFNTISNGAVLRTIAETQKTFNFFDTASKWSITVEEQDATKGQIFKEVRLYSKHTKGTVTSAEKFIKSFSASSFQVAGNRDLPQGKIEISLSEALTALNIAPNGYTPADRFTMRLELVLTDGRIFTDANTSAPVTNGYFSSSFVYSVQFFCPLANAADFNGNYRVTVDDWQDYAVGDIIPVSYVPADGTYKFRILCSANTFILNGATTYLIVTINPITAAVTVAANQPFLYAPAEPPTTVTGVGTVGSCTGDINLKLKFTGGFTGNNQTLNLVKQ